MKNLKQVGAVALAAVMAVAFAPVASLNVFAAGSTGSKTALSQASEADAHSNPMEGGTWCSAASTFGEVTKGDNTLDLLDVTDAPGVKVTGGTLTVQDKNMTGASPSVGWSSTTDSNGKVTETTSANGSKAAKLTLTITDGDVVLDSSLGQYGAADIDEITVTITGGKLTVKGGRVTLSGVTGGTINVEGGEIDNFGNAAKAANLDADSGYGTAVVSMTGGVYSNTSAPEELVKFYGSDKVMVAGSSPVAQLKLDVNTANVVAVGDSIQKVYDLLGNDNKDEIIALNGDVVVSDLASKDIAHTSANEPSGKATITATAAKDTSLAEIVTDFGYDWENGNVTGSAAYTAKKYVAGASTITTDSTNGVSKLGKAHADLNTSAVKAGVTVNKETYDRAITITQAKDWTDKTAKLTSLTQVDTVKDKASVTKDGSTGITYFTADPSEYTNTANAIAVIDGTKYVIGEASETAAINNTLELDAAADSAKSSIELKNLPGWTKGKGNSVSYATFQVETAGLKVTGPEDTSVASTTETDNTNGVTTNKVSYDIFGVEEGKKANNSLDTMVTTNGFGAIDTNNSARSIYVSAVVKGSTITVPGVYTDVKVDRAQGLDYFSYTEGNATVGYVFGQTADASTELSKRLSGYTEGALKVDPVINASSVFVSAGIKGTYKDVSPLAVIKGEISADSTKQEDGKYTWVINGGEVSKYQKMYRFRNTITGEHFYACDEKEVATLQGEEGKAAGWVDETEAKNSYKVLPATSTDGVAVYRLFNSIANEHFFTTSKEEANAAVAANCGWTLEGNNGVAFKAAPADTEEATVTVYRMHRPSDDAHLFTPDEAEVTWLLGLGQGWEKEGETGVAFYGFK